MATNKYSLVFLVDDDETILDSLENHLQKERIRGVAFKKFSTGEQCLQELHQKPDIIILDYYLNSKNKNAMNGIEVLKKIKSSARNTEVLMLSGQDSLEVAVNCIKNGAHDYIIKNESAFVRAAHLLKNLVHNIKLKRDAKVYEFWNWIFAGFFLALVLFDIIYLINKK
jgi:two-component system, OmpR family, response regulator